MPPLVNACSALLIFLLCILVTACCPLCCITAASVIGACLSSCLLAAVLLAPLHFLHRMLPQYPTDLLPLTAAFFFTHPSLVLSSFFLVWSGGTRKISCGSCPSFFLSASYSALGPDIPCVFCTASARVSVSHSTALCCLCAVNSLPMPLHVHICLTRLSAAGGQASVPQVDCPHIYLLPKLF